MKEEIIKLSMGEVTIKELSFGDDNNATRKALEETLIKGRQELDIVTKREFALLESIIKCPFQKNIETIRGLSRADGLKLSAAFNKLNEVVPGESKNSEQESLKNDTSTEK